jgi:hypothetical protein
MYFFKKIKEVVTVFFKTKGWLQLFKKKLDVFIHCIYFKIKISVSIY